MIRVCSIEGCGKKLLAKGLCSKHYYQTPEVKERARAYRQAAESKALKNKRQQTPEYKSYQRAYRQTVEAKAARKLREETPERRAYQLSYGKEYRDDPRHKARKYEQHRIRLKGDPLYRFIRKMRHLIRHSFKRRSFKKGSATEIILGCSVERFVENFASKLQPGMTLVNHGQWHIDHIIPLATAKTEEDVIRLCHYTNLQPLWAIDNKHKGGKAA